MLFSVRRTFGPDYDRDSPLSAQAGWKDHAGFMDDLTAEGFVLVGGPLGEGGVQLAVMAADEAEVRTRLADDPWGEDMLMLTEVRPWRILLGVERIDGWGDLPGDETTDLRRPDR